MSPPSSPFSPHVSTSLMFARPDNLEVGNESLRDLCDAVRVSLRDHKTLGPQAEEMKKMLLRVVKGECTGATAVSFATVRDAHLDKLLNDMLNADNIPATASDEFRANSKIARSLQKAWQVRFQGDYFRIDHERLDRLKMTGRLRDVEFVGPQHGTIELWQAKLKDSMSELEEDRHFEPGHWWLNLACAHRDGMVGSARETPTKGRYDDAALPLMTGSENVWPDKVMYSRYGRTMADMHVALMSRVGKSIRILRGHNLHSPFSPVAGVRYDGKYRIKQYGVMWKPDHQLYQLRLVMERLTADPDGPTAMKTTTQDVKPVKHMREVTQRPSPSELDDWKLYEVYESELVKQRMGNPVFMDWSVEKGKLQGEREHWRRVYELQLDLKKVWAEMSN